MRVAHRSFAFVALLLSSCAMVPALQLTQLHAAPGSDKSVVLLTSGRLPIYDEVAKSIGQQLDANLYITPSLSDTDRDRLAASIRERHPTLLISLGPIATSFAQSELHDVPLLFAMVVNYRGHGLTDSTAMGVALETPPLAEFSQFMLVLPQIKRVLAFHSKSTEALVEQARADLATLGITLDAVAIANESEIPEALDRHLPNADAVWMLSDAVVMTRKTFSLFKEQTLLKRKPFVASLSDEFAERGALMSVSVDFTSLGGQVAGMAQRYLREGKPVGVEQPIGAKLVLNLDTAKSIGVDVPIDVMPFIGKVVNAPR